MGADPFDTKLRASALKDSGGGGSVDVASTVTTLEEIGVVFVVGFDAIWL